MKSPKNLAKRGRKPKVTRTLPIELLPIAWSWLEVLHGKGRFGNTLDAVVVTLLNDRFKQLLEDGELKDPIGLERTIPFPSAAPRVSTFDDKIHPPAVNSASEKQDAV
jgi:hypothetical protein